jgi:hypothetical protein
VRLHLQSVKGLVYNIKVSFGLGYCMLL